MTVTSLTRRNNRPAPAPTHLFAVGQIVRLKGGFGIPSQSTDIFHITGQLPPRGDSPQYRVRNDTERHERVMTQDSLVPLEVQKLEDSSTLIERTFGHGQEAETQQPGD